MGGCLSIHRVILRPSPGGGDLSESTFSHYSLTSESSYLDLYPTFHYVESVVHPDSSSCNASIVSEWRRSSVPLIEEEDENDEDPRMMVEDYDDEEEDSLRPSRLFKYSIFNTNFLSSPTSQKAACACMPMFKSPSGVRRPSPRTLRSSKDRFPI